jgi:hypothetical protein
MLTPLRILRALDHAQQTYSEVQSPDVPTCRYAGCIRTGPTTWRPSALSCSRPSSPWAEMAGNTLRKWIGSESLSKARTVSLLGNWIGAIITILRLNNFCKQCVLSQEVECCRLRQSVVRLGRMDACARSQSMANKPCKFLLRLADNRKPIQRSAASRFGMMPIGFQTPRNNQRSQSAGLNVLLHKEVLGCPYNRMIDACNQCIIIVSSQ